MNNNARYNQTVCRRNTVQPSLPRQGRTCGCNRNVSGMTDGDTDTLNNLPLANVYPPSQSWQDIYGNAEALMQGTVFEQLDKQFSGENKSTCGRCGQ